ncbi:MAG: deoxyuridine 5'-triphosphate nucleotidohydrolase [Spirochaetaceae bacterium 4572_59]|nr:MAG: deoxyuridine 5'-triphosphate nucleotidohydrolase [Spirochaetaceae bacterium 4572_59]
MENIKVAVSGNPEMIPHYGSELAAGADLRADLTDPVFIEPGQRCIIPTGLRLAIPCAYEGQVRPRSGLAAKYGITVLNTPGTIDADYRGDVKVILINLGQESFTIKRGDRIAQLIIAPVLRADFILKEDLDETDRGHGGFGSTGRA